MSPTAPPPQLPPQVSPDGKWVWDGRQWQPVAVSTWVPAAAAAIPQAVAPTPPPVAVEPPRYVAPEEVLAQAPSYNFQVAAPVSPRWQKPAERPKTYIYVAGGVVVLIMVMLVLNSLSVVPFHWFESNATPTARPVAPSPVPQSVARTDFDRADRFLNQLLAPAIVGINESWQPLFATCNGPLSGSCLSAIKVTDQQMIKLLAVINQSEIPQCIAPGMVKVRGDAVAMEAGIQIALKGFTDNNPAETKAGLNQYGSMARTFGADLNSVDATHKTLCDTQEVGP